MTRSDKVSPEELEALRIYRIEGKPGWEAYMAVHPKSSVAAAKAHAGAFLKNAERKLSNQQLLELYDLGPGRIYREINEGLKAMTEYTYKGLKTGETAPDRTNRNRTLELLAKIVGMVDSRRTEITAEGGDSLHIVIDN